jgi:hypothetical protein
MSKFEISTEYSLFAQDCFMRLVSRDSLVHPVDDRTLAETAMFAFKATQFYFAAFELEKARLQGKATHSEQAELLEALRASLSPMGKAINAKAARNAKKSA